MRLLAICLLLTSGLMLSAAPLQNTSWQTPAEDADESKQQELDENLQPVSPKNAQPAESGPTVVTEMNDNISYPSKEPDRKNNTASGSSSGRNASSRESRQPAAASLPKIDRRVYQYNLLDGNPNLRYRRTDRGYEIVDENNRVIRSVVVRQSDKTDKTTQKKTSKAKIKHGKIDYCHDQVLTRDQSCTVKKSCSGSSCTVKKSCSGSSCNK